MPDYYIDPSSVMQNPRIRRALARIERMPEEQRNFMVENLLASGAGQQMGQYLQMIDLKNRTDLAKQGLGLSKKGLEQRGEMSKARMEQTKGISLAELALREKLGNAQLEQQRYISDLTTGYREEERKARLPWEIAGLGVSALGALQQYRNTEEEKAMRQKILGLYGG